MKRFLYFAFVLLLAASCVKEIPGFDERMENEPTVPVILSFEQPITLQARTKADAGMEMGVNPAISSIHVAVFGSSGYLKDYTSATPCDASGNPISGFVEDNATTAYFLVRLPVSTSKRFVHIIANGPASLPFNAYENDIMLNLSVTDGNGAYWQRLVLNDGITADQDPVTEEFIPTAATAAVFSNLKLVRNFAGVTVTESADNFEIVSYTLCNMPWSGSIAIYSANHGGWVSASDYTDAFQFVGAADPKPGFLRYDNKYYNGFPTNPALDTDIPRTAQEFNAAGVAVAPGETIFVYERAVTNENPPFILMAARWVESGDPSSAAIKYYRLDITTDYEYFPFYRNYMYQINISDVEVEGYDDPGTAAAHNSGDNFSVSLDTQTLPDVSNGVIRLFVEQPFYNLLYTNAEQEFWFQLFLNSNSSYINGNVTVTEKDGGNALESYSVETSDRTGNKRYVKFRLKSPEGTSTLSSKLKLTGTYVDNGEVSRLSREVTINVFNARDIHPTLTPNTVAPQAGQFTTLGIPLPLDFDRSMFPMELLIEDSAKALNPAETENMPVKLDIKSLTDNSTPSYCFVRTLNWTEYERLKKDAELSGQSELVVNCEFETIKDFSSTTVYVYNDYFTKNGSGVTTAQVTLGTDADNLISPNRQTVSGTSATVQVKSSGAWSLSIELANGGTATGTSLSLYSGNSTTGTDITVTLPENDSKNAIGYKLTLHNTEEDIERSAYLTQLGTTMEITTATTEISNQANNVSVTVQSGISYRLEVLDEHGNRISITPAFSADPYPATTTPTVRTVNVPGNPTLSARTITIRLRNAGESLTIYDDVTITQAAGTASLTVTDIPMLATSATINVNASFPTIVKVFNNASEVVFTSSEISEPGNVEVPVGSATGSSRTFTVKLYNLNGDEVVTETFTQKPMLILTTSNSSIAGNVQTATVHIVSDFAWNLGFTVSGGSGGSGSPTLSQTSGAATDASGVDVTLSDMPVNYSTSDPRVFTVTATATGADDATTTITQRVARINDGSRSFNTRNSNNGGEFLNNSTTSVTKDGVTATFANINQYPSNGGTWGIGARNYLELTSNNTLTINCDGIANLRTINGLSMSFDGNNYTATAVTATDDQSASIDGVYQNNSSWTTSVITTRPLTFKLRRNNNNYTIRMTGFTVSFQYYTWN